MHPHFLDLETEAQRDRLQASQCQPAELGAYSTDLALKWAPGSSWVP